MGSISADSVHNIISDHMKDTIYVNLCQSSFTWFQILESRIHAVMIYFIFFRTICEKYIQVLINFCFCQNPSISFIFTKYIIKQYIVSAQIHYCNWHQIQFQAWYKHYILQCSPHQRFFKYNIYVYLTPKTYFNTGTSTHNYRTL